MAKWVVVVLLFLPFFSTVLSLAMTLGGWDCRRSSKILLGLQFLLTAASLFVVPWHHPSADLGQWHMAWSSYLQVTLSLGSAPLVQAALFSVFLPLATAVFISREEQDFSEPQYISLHLFSLGLSGAFLAANLLTYTFFLGFLSLATALLLSGDKNLCKGDVAARMLGVEIGSLLLLGLGVVALQHQTTAHLDSWLYINLGERLLDTRSLLFFIVILGLLLRSWLFPFSLYRLPFQNAHTKGLVPVLYLSGFVGAYGMLRFVPLLFPQEWNLHAHGIAALAVLTCLFAAARLLYKTAAADIAVGILSLFQALLIGGLATVRVQGLTGAWVLFFFSGFALALLGYFLMIGEQKAVAAPRAPLLSLMQRSGAVIANLVAAGAPVSMGFVGIVLVLWGLALWNLVGFVAALVCTAVVWFSLFRYVSANGVDLSLRGRWESAAALALVLLAFASLVFSHWLIEALRPSVLLALQQLGGQA